MTKGGRSPETSLARATRRRWMPIVAAAAVAAAFAGGAFLGRRSAHAEPPEFRQLTFARGFVHSARFAPDGQTVIYGAAFEGRPLALFTTRTDAFESRPFDLPSADVAGISRDGQMALILGRRHVRSWLRVGTLAQVAIAGGSPREILDGIFDADIAPDGKQFAVVVADGDDQVLQFPIGKEIFRVRGWISQPRIAPDGKRVAFVSHRVWGDDLGEIHMAGADGKVVRLTSEEQYSQGLCWSPRDGDLWFTTADNIGGGTLWRVSPGNAPRVVLRTPALIRVQDIAGDGRILLMTDEGRAELAGQLAGDTGERVYTWWDNEAVSAISDDGTLYAGQTYSVVVDGEYGVYFRREGGPPVQIGPGLALGMTPDSKYVVSTRLTGKHTTLTMLPVGPGQPKAIDLGNVALDIYPGQHLSFSSDGRRIAFTGAKPGSGRAVYVMDLEGGVPRAVSPEGAYSAILSPDGSKVVVADPKRGLYLVPSAGGPPQPVAGAAKDDEPLAWTSDGQAILSWNATLPPRIYKIAVDGGRRELVRELAPADPAGILYGWLTLSRDGRFYLQRSRRVLSSVYLVTLR